MLTSRQLGQFRRAFSSWHKNFKKNGKVNRILMTGAQGQVGSTMLPLLNDIYGKDNIFCIDISNRRKLPTPNFEVCEITDGKKIEEIVKKFQPDTIYHLSSIVSAYGEQHPDEALRVNNGGFETILNLARKYKTKLYSASTIASFGPSTPKVDVPNITIQRPETIYGVTKVYMELLGSYYTKKFGVDFRCLRYPIVISAAMPGPVTARCTVEVYYEALKNKKYTTYLRPEHKLPMIYIDDVVEGTIKLMEADETKLSTRVYNLPGFSSSMEEIAASIRKHIPDFKMETKTDFRQGIADTWPQSLDGKVANKDWGYAPRWQLDNMSVEMLRLVGENVKKGVEA